MNYETVTEYLKSFSLSEPPYDPNGAIHLLKAIVENLQVNFNDNDLEEYSSCLTEANEAFLRKLLKEIPNSRNLEK